VVSGGKAAGSGRFTSAMILPSLSGEAAKLIESCGRDDLTGIDPWPFNSAATLLTELSWTYVHVPRGLISLWLYKENNKLRN
jgi:hypothetical protein